MGKPNQNPIERQPQYVIPFGWHALHNYGRSYRVRGPKPEQDTWESVADRFMVDVEELIYFNFLTTQPDEVNWYLHYHTGCNKPSPSGNNWMFSNSANPGIIFIPPPENREEDFEPAQVCPWVPSSVKNFIQRLVAVSQIMSGYTGQRVQKLVGVIQRVGYPACRDLWYYNDMNVLEYVDFKTKYSKLIEMTKATQGAFPFDGDSGLYGQAGTPERNRGQWRIHAVNDLFEEFSCGPLNASDLEDYLEGIDDLMYKGWHAMSDVADRTAGGGGGSAYHPLVYEFIHHVQLLSQDATHLYSAFRP